MTGGTYTFNPTNAEYAAAGVAVSPYAVLTEDATAKTWTLTLTPSTQVGDDAWARIKDGVCTIYGTGTTWDFSNTDNPLDASWDSVKDVVVADGVTGLGAYIRPTH